MIQDYGTVRPGTTLYIPFHTFDSNDPSASVTLTGLATTDIEIYKDGGTTQRASDNGYALLDTDGIDIDGITGIHGISVSLADNSTAGFYAAGSQYWIVISSITVDAATINFILATFRIGYEDAVINTTIATLASQTSFTLTSGPAEDDALNGCVVCIHDVASAVQLGYGVVSDYTGSTKTVTLAAGTTFTAAAADNISIFPPTNAHTVSSGAVTAIQSGLATAAALDTVDNLIDTEVAAIKTVVDGIQTDLDNGTDGLGALKTLIDAVDNFVDTEVASILAAVDTEVGAIKTVTDQFVFSTANRVNAQVFGMEANTVTAASAAADLTTELQTGLATSANVTTILSLIADLYADVDAYQVINVNLLNGLALASGTIGATGNTPTTLHLAGLAYANDAINSMTLVIKDVSTGLSYSRWIEGWADTGDLATVATLPFTPQASTDLYWILPIRSDVTGGSGLDAAGVRAAVGLASANLDTQLDALPTNAELATALGTADDAVLAAIAALNNLSQANIRTALGMASANFDTQIGDLPTNAELATALGTADDAVLAAVAALNNLSSAQAQTAAAAALSAYDPPTRAEATSDKDEILADTNDIQTRIPAALTAGGNIKADALAIDGSTTAADRLQRSAEAIAFATVGSGSTTTSIVTSAIDPSATVADQFKGRIVIFDKATTTAALRGQATDITASTSGGVLTVTALTTAPASGDTFTIT